MYAHMYLNAIGNLLPNTPGYDDSLQRIRQGLWRKLLSCCVISAKKLSGRMFGRNFLEAKYMIIAFPATNEKKLCFFTVCIKKLMTCF